MNHTLINISGILSSSIYIIGLLIAVTMPLWGYQIISEKLEGKHQALRVSDSKNKHRSTSILASVGTTTAGVFLIQVLPLLFSIINDVGGSYAVNTVYSEHLASQGAGQYVGEFYGLAAQLGEMLQQGAPIAAVGLGGYNLLNNISRGLPAIIRK